MRLFVAPMDDAFGQMFEYSIRFIENVNSFHPFSILSLWSNKKNGTDTFTKKTIFDALKTPRDHRHHPQKKFMQPLPDGID